MSIEERLYAALSPLGLDVDCGVSRSRADRYIVFSVMTLPDGYADDDATYERALVTVRLALPLDMNPTALRDAVKNALHGAGFTLPAVTDASDENGRALVFECEETEDV